MCICSRSTQLIQTCSSYIYSNHLFRFCFFVIVFTSENTSIKSCSNTLSLIDSSIFLNTRISLDPFLSFLVRMISQPPGTKSPGFFKLPFHYGVNLSFFQTASTTTRPRISSLIFSLSVNVTQHTGTCS